MYTLVLMTAVSTAPATPQFDGLFRDWFRGNCHGSETRSNTAAAGNCNGCCGGGGLFHGRIRHFFADLFDGGSCHGSCHGGCTGSRPRDRDPLPAARPYDRSADPGYGYARGGCNGGGYAAAPLYLGSCFGSTPNYSCFGSSCMGGFAPMSVPGVPYDYAPPQPVGYATGPGCDCATGGTVGLPQYGVSPGLPPLGAPVSPDGYQSIPSPGVPLPRPGEPFDNPARPQPVDGRGSYKLPADDPADATRGRVLVRLPLDAKLFVEGKQLTVKDGERTFVTPPLPGDREAVYAFKVEYSRDGDTVTHARKVKVRANGTTVVDFTDLAGLATKADPVKSLPPVPAESLKTPATDAVKAPPADAGKPPEFDSRTTTRPKADDIPTLTPPPQESVAKITVKLPKGATLYVNGGKNERTELVREFTTPTLTAGKAYQYTMRAELTRNGLPEYQESKVDFKAGDVLTVDFTSLADPAGDKRAGK